MLQFATARGCVIATLFGITAVANQRTGLDELKNGCRMIMAGANSLLVTLLSSVIAFAASNTTISASRLRHPSR